MSYFHQLLGSKKTVIFHLRKNGSLATSKQCSMLKKISYRFWFFLRAVIELSFLKTLCKLLLSSNFLRWMQSSCLYFLFFRNVFLLTILKGQKPFWLQAKSWKWIKELLALECCRNQNKVISILNETHINHD